MSTMIEYVRNEFRSEDPGVLFAIGLALSVTGLVAASGAGSETISTVLGLVVQALGVSVLVATGLWGGVWDSGTEPSR